MIRPLTPKAKTVLKIGAALAVVAFILFIWANARPNPVQVRVTFTGFTNTNAPTPALTPVAYFCVSNAGTCPVFQEREQWIEIKLLGRSASSVLIGDLKPGEFTISGPEPLPENRYVDNEGNLVRQNKPWRLTLTFSKADWREKLVRNPPRVLRKVLQLVPARWLERHPIEVHSDWVNGPELMPVATNTAKAAHE